ncbi:MAG: hypothetical protein KDA78_09915 [Planctomycetaceae bacterium]|nr:hypothetical protein [Planctomycetaceae bacterium]
MPPRTVHQFRAEAEVTGCCPMWEADDLVVADSIGTLYRLDPVLNVKLLTRLQEPVQQLAWSATGEFGAALLGKSTIVRLNAQLKQVWAIEVPFDCQCLAIDPYGVFTLVSATEGGVVILDDRAKKASVFETMRPLANVQFVIEEPTIIAAAEHGLLAAYDLTGKKIWDHAFWSNVSDLAVVQQDCQIRVAALNQGIQVFDHHGESKGSVILDGTVNHLATNYSGNLTLASTVEKQLFRLDEDGSTLWSAECAEEILSVHVHAIQPVGYFSTEGKRVVRLEWK